MPPHCPCGVGALPHSSSPLGACNDGGVASGICRTLAEVPPGPGAVLEAARRAVLVTTAPNGTPRPMPVCFAVRGGEIVTAVDHKPKSGAPLARIADIRSWSQPAKQSRAWAETEAQRAVARSTSLFDLTLRCPSARTQPTKEDRPRQTQPPNAASSPRRSSAGARGLLATRRGHPGPRLESGGTTRFLPRLPTTQFRWKPGTRS